MLSITLVLVVPTALGSFLLKVASRRPSRAI
jgi:hypothetical protein